MPDPRSTQLKALKGSDLKVLIAMALLGAVNIGNRDIKKFSGLSYPTVASCLENLAEEGLVTKTHRTKGWHITENGRQLLLPTEPSTKFLHSEAIINIDNPLNTLVIKDSNTNNTEASEKIFDSEIVKSLNAIGIYNPKASDLACLDHMTQQYINAWDLALQFGKVGKGGNDVPLAIHLMDQGTTAPIVSKEEQEAETCTECGNSSIGHGGNKNCFGGYLYYKGVKL